MSLNQEEEDLLTYCLYFTSSRFARNIAKLADQAIDGELAPSYYYMMLVVHFHPDITQKELSQRLSLAPSTSTRFLDKLEALGWIHRTSRGKQSHVRLTTEGEEVYGSFRQALKQLFADYAAILGKDESKQLSKSLRDANEKLERA